MKTFQRSFSLFFTMFVYSVMLSGCAGGTPTTTSTNTSSPTSTDTTTQTQTAPLNIASSKMSYTSSEKISLKLTLKDKNGNPVTGKGIAVYDPLSKITTQTAATDTTGYVEYAPTASNIQNGYYVIGFQAPDGTAQSYGFIINDGGITSSDGVKIIQVGQQAKLVMQDGGGVIVGTLGQQDPTDNDKILEAATDTLIETASNPAVITTGLLCSGAAVAGTGAVLITVATGGAASPTVIYAGSVATVACGAFVETTTSALAVNGAKNAAKLAIDSYPQITTSDKNAYKELVEKGVFVYSLTISGIKIIEGPQGGKSIVSYAISSNNKGNFANEFFKQFIGILSGLYDGANQAFKLMDVSTTVQKISDNACVVTIKGKDPQTGLYTIQSLVLQNPVTTSNTVSSCAISSVDISLSCESNISCNSVAKDSSLYVNGSISGTDTCTIYSRHKVDGSAAIWEQRQMTKGLATIPSSLIDTANAGRHSVQIEIDQDGNGTVDISSSTKNYEVLSDLSNGLALVVTPTGNQTATVYGQQFSYTLTVKEDNGNPVSGAAVGVSDKLQGVEKQKTTDAQGEASYTTIVPSGAVNGTYNIVFGPAKKSGYSDSSSVNRNVVVNIATCAPGTKRCNENDLEQCNANGQWEGIQSCGAGCTDGVCNTLPCTYGDKRCSSAGNVEQCMDDGSWTGIQTCANGCRDGSCVPPQSTTCLDGTTYGSCSSGKPKYCDNGSLVNNCATCGCYSGYSCQNDGSCAQLQTYKLTINKSGTGNGEVNVDPPSVTVSSYSYASGTPVTITATSASGSTFTGWSGDCSGTSSTFTVKMYSDKNCTATFNVIPALTLTATLKSGNEGAADWGDSIVYTLEVKDQNGASIADAQVPYKDYLNTPSNPLEGYVTTQADGKIPYPTQVPSGKVNGNYNIIFGPATKPNYTSISPVTKTVTTKH